MSETQIGALWCGYCEKWYRGLHDCPNIGGNWTPSPENMEQLSKMLGGASKSSEYERGHKRGYNDALEAVVKWHKARAGDHYVSAGVFLERSVGYKIAMDLAVAHDKSAAHVRSMKKP